jgi:hypothetical protein
MKLGANNGPVAPFPGSIQQKISHVPGTIFALETPEGNVAKYGKAAEKTITSAMRRKKRGTLKSSSGQTVKSRKQAIAIGISEARAKGAKVPPKPKRKSAKKKR